MTLSTKVRASLCAFAAMLGFWMTSAAIVRADWAPPGNLPANTGRIWSIAVNPTNVNYLMIGTDQGLYLSSDSGATWKATSVHGVRVWTAGWDLRSPHAAFAGTANHGVYKSTDGTTWTAASTGLSSMNVRSFAFALSGIAAGTDNGVDFLSGDTWGAIGLGNVSISALAVASHSPSLVLLAGTDSGNVSKGSVYINGDKGWNVLGSPNGLRDGAFTSSISSGPPTQAIPHRTLLVTMSAAPSSGSTTTYPATYKSVDGGANWTASQGITQLGGVQPIGLTTSAFSPLDPSLVYAGSDAGGSSGNDISGSVGGDLMRSSDGGGNFSEYTTGLPADTRNVETVAVAPTVPPTIYIGIDSDKHGTHIYKATDTNAPQPPQLLAESPGTSPQTAAVQSTPPPTHVNTTPAPAKTQSAFGKIIGTVFGWPTPLSYELLTIVALWYGVLWYRQRRYVDGPPD